jgi:hypothetical protein
MLQRVKMGIAPKKTNIFHGSNFWKSDADFPLLEHGLKHLELAALLLLVLLFGVVLFEALPARIVPRSVLAGIAVLTGPDGFDQWSNVEWDATKGTQQWKNRARLTGTVAREANRG